MKWLQILLIMLSLSACGGGGDNSNEPTGGSGNPPVAAPVADWETHQGSAAHRGFVPLTLDATRFAVAWQWQREASAEPVGGINAVVTAGGKVFVSHDVYFGDGVLYALNENSGAEVWRASFGQVPAMGPPAVNDGRVYVPTTGHEKTAVWAFDSGSGRYLFKSAFDGQWPNAHAPTVHRSRVFVGGGYYGGQTYAYDKQTGARLWAASTGGVWDQFTPAVDDQFVYHHTGIALTLIDPVSGQVAATIADPFGSADNYSYHGAPVIGSMGNVIAFSGGNFSGRASSNTEPYNPRVLTSFDVANRRINWQSQNSYITAPAVAAGVVYAGSNRSPALHALDEATGRLLWSWTVPENLSNESFHRNVIATNNLVFASTAQKVYAIDIATRQHVWSYPKAGMLALSGDGTLFIATGATSSDGGLVAVRLK